MKVIDRIAPVVLNVPTEARETHAHVSPGHLHPGYISVYVAQHRPLDVGDVVEVPTRAGVLLLLGGGGFLLLGEAAA